MSNSIKYIYETPPTLGGVLPDNWNGTGIYGYVCDCTITKHVDGDSIWLSSDFGLIGDNTEARFIGLNTPELIPVGHTPDPNDFIDKYKLTKIAEYSNTYHCSQDEAIKAGRDAATFTNKLMPVGSTVRCDITAKSWPSNWASNPVPTELASDTTGSRILVVFYKQLKDGTWININKTILANGYAEATDFNDTQVFTGDWNKLIPKTNKTKTEPQTSRKTTTKVSYPKTLAMDNDSYFIGNTIEIEPRDNERIDEVLRPPGYTQIGDIELIIPPLAINVSQQMKNHRVNVLRGAGSIQTKGGYSETLVQMELFFNGAGAINGYPVKGPDNKTMWINGLRPLIAQFKKAPFVPIVNENLNIDYKIWAVALKNITARTVIGYPNCIAVTITMTSFDHTGFMCFTEDFYQAIHWPIFRWYCQKPMRDTQSTHHLKPVPSTGVTNTLTFGLVSEDSIKDYDAKLKKFRNMEKPVTRKYPLKNTVYGQIQGDMSELALGKEQRRRFLSGKRTYAELLYSEVTYEQQDVKFYSPDIAGGVGWDIDVNALTLLNNQTTGYILKLKYQPNIRDAEAILHAHQISNGHYLVPIDSPLLAKIEQRADSYQKYVQAYETEYDNLQDEINSVEQNLKFKQIDIEDLHINAITVSGENVFSALQVQNISNPSYQYLGSQDNYIQLAIQTNHSSAGALLQIVRTAERYSRQYRINANTGFLSIKNDLINLFGIQHVVIENIEITTVKDTPELVQVLLTMVAFNKTQRQAEALEVIDVFDNPKIKSINQLPSYYELYDVAPELKIMGAELYPDLGLPTWEELQEFCQCTYHPTDITGYRANPAIQYPFDQRIINAISNNEVHPLYVDPDFYVITPRTMRQILNETMDDLSTSSDEKSQLTLHDNYDPSGSARVKMPSAQDTTLDTIAPLEWISDKTTAAMASILGKSQTRKSKISSKAKTTGENDHADKVNSDGSNFTEPEKSQTGAKYAETTVGSASASSFTPSTNQNLSAITYISNDSPSTNWDNPTSIKKAQLDKLPSVQEWQKWKNFKTLDEATSNLKVNCGVNPSSKVVLDNMISEVANLVGPSGFNTTKFIHHMKAVIAWEHRGGWNQFVSRPSAVDNKTRSLPILGGDLDMGLGQLTPQGNGFSLDQARRAAWDWKYNLHMTIKHFLNCCQACKGAYPNASEEYIFQCAIIMYNTGRGVPREKASTAGQNYYDGVMTQYKKLYDQSTVKKLPGGDYSTVANKDWVEVSTNDDASGQGMAQTSSDGVAKVTTTEKQPSLNPYEMLIRSCNEMMKHDQRGRLVRAFPTFLMFLIDEGRYVQWIKLWDNFYGFNSIQSIDIVKSRKSAADTAVVRMTNIYDNLTQYDMDDIKNGQMYKKYADEYGFSDVVFNNINTNTILEARKEKLNSLMLKTGARIHLRLGYGSCGLDLSTVFNGTISEVSAASEMVEIVAIGDGVEITNPVAADPTDVNNGTILGKEPRSTMLYYMTGYSGYWTNLKNNIIDVEANEAPGFWAKNTDAAENPYGIVHFGNPFEHVPSEYNSLFVEFGENGSNTPIGEIGINMYTTNCKATHSQTWYDTYSQEKVSGGKPSAWNTMKMWASGDEPDVVVPLFGRSVWDLANTFSLITPDYITTVLPFGFHSTLFFGRPHWPYFYDYDLTYEFNETKQMYERKAKDYRWKTMEQHHIYTSQTDIISNQIKASEEGVFTNVIINYKKSNGTQKVTNTIHMDTDIYPEKQKTAIVDLDIFDEATFQAIRLAQETGAEKMAYIAGGQILRDYAKDMYKGDLIVIGDPTIKPYDTMSISDNIFQMSGICGVKTVIHHFSHETGFVTNITPDCLAVVDDPLYINHIMWKSQFSHNTTMKLLGAINFSLALYAITRIPFGQIISRYATKGKEALRTAYNLISDSEFETFEEVLEATKTSTTESKLGKTIAKATNKAFDVAKATKYGTKAVDVGKAARTAVTGSKTITTIGEIAAAGGAVVAAAPAAVAAAVIDIVVMVLADGVLDMYSRWKKNRQAILIIPLHSYGKPLTAGINGHQGCVIGDSPGKFDKLAAGQSDGWENCIAMALNFMSGSDKQYSYEDITDVGGED